MMFHVCYRSAFLVSLILGYYHCATAAAAVQSDDLFPYHNVWESPANGEPSQGDFSKGDDLDYIRRVLQRVPMHERLREHIYDNDPFDYEINWERIAEALAVEMLSNIDLARELVEALQEYSHRTSWRDPHAQQQSSSESTSPRQLPAGYDTCIRDLELYYIPVINDIANQVIELILGTQQCITSLQFDCIDPPGLLPIIFPICCNLSAIYPLPTRAVNNSLLAEDRWAARLYDSNAKVPPGVLEGKLHFVGRSVECNAVADVPPPEIRNTTTFGGKYCRIDIQRTIDNSTNTTATRIWPLQIGLCFPDTCHSEHIHHYYTSETLFAAASLVASLEVSRVYCGHAENNVLSEDYYAKVAFATSLVFIIIVIIATCYDGFGRKNYLRRKLLKLAVHGTEDAHLFRRRGKFSEENGMPSNEILEHLKGRPSISERMEVGWAGLSLYSNVGHIFSTKTHKDHFPVIDGVRSLAFLWTIAGMTWVYGIVYFECWTVDNLLSAAETIPRNWTFMPILGTANVNHLFYVVSGASCVLSFMRRYEQSGKRMDLWKFTQYFMHRYWAFMPAIMLVLNLYMNAYKYLGDGPINPPYIQDAENCRDHWWVTLLMMHNVMYPSSQCFAWSFVMASIFQLNFISMFALLPLIYLPGIAYFFIAGFFVAGIVSCAIISEQVVRGENDRNVFNHIWQAPWVNATQYAVGMALGVLLLKVRNGKRPKMHKAGITWLWFFATAGVLTVLFAPYNKYKEGGQPWSEGGDVAWDVLSPLLFSLSTAWIIYACSVGWGGAVERVLKWRGFAVFSKLCFPALLFHAPSMTSPIYGLKTLVYIHPGEMGMLLYANIGSVLFIGFAIALFFHFPWSVGIRKCAEFHTRLEGYRYGRHPEILDFIAQGGDDPYNNVKIEKKLPQTPNGLVHADSPKKSSLQDKQVAPSYASVPGVGNFVPVQEIPESCEQHTPPPAYGNALSKGVDNPGFTPDRAPDESTAL